MIFVVKKLGSDKPLCITRNKEFAFNVVRVERSQGNDDYYVFECDDIKSLSVLIGEQYAHSCAHYL